MNWFIIAGFHKARTNFFSLKKCSSFGNFFPLSLIVKQPRSSDVPLTWGGVTLFRRTEGSKLKSRSIKVGRLRFHRLFNSPKSTQNFIDTELIFQKLVENLCLQARRQALEQLINPSTPYKPNLIKCFFPDPCPLGIRSLRSSHQQKCDIFNQTNVARL